MKDLLGFKNLIREKTILRYITTGLFVYILELIIIFLAQARGFSATKAVAIAFWSGLTTSFILQKLITFGDKRSHHKILIPQIIAFSALVLFNFVFTLLLTSIMVKLLPAVLIRTIALGITTIWNFYLYKTKIFKSEQNVLY